MSDDVSQLRRDVEDNGFTLVRRTAHSWLYADANGSSIGVPTSPSDYRSISNTRAELRRAVAARQGAGVPLVACKRCGVEKPISTYRVTKFGTVKTCNACASEAQVATRAKNKALVSPPPTPPAEPVNVTPENPRRPPAEPRKTRPQATTAVDDVELAALRVLRHRHRDEYDRLVEEQMIAKGWDA